MGMMMGMVGMGGDMGIDGLWVICFIWVGDWYLNIERCYY